MNQLLNSITEPAINDWFKKQCANPFEAFYLYCRKARTGETIACPIISTEAPNCDYFLAMPDRISPAWTKDIAHNKCVEALRKQPILGA